MNLDYFEKCMQLIASRLDRLEAILKKNNDVSPFKLDGEQLMDNQDVCKMLNISKRTLQRYRSSRQLPYFMLYHKTFYKESDVYSFIQMHFNRFSSKK